MPSRYDAFIDEESDEGNNDDGADGKSNNIPNYEDLSVCRADEETVLRAVYGDDFSINNGVWGCTRLNVHVRPPDLEKEAIGCEVTLSVQTDKKYPYFIPRIELRNLKGLNEKEEIDLMKLLNEAAGTCASTGTVMMCELVMVAEDFLLARNKDPRKGKMSAWEQMKAREKNEEEERKALKMQEDRMKYVEESSGHIFVEESTTNNGLLPAVGVEKELKRQMAAFRAAQFHRGKNGDLSDAPIFEKDKQEEEDYYDYEDETSVSPAVFGSSRYRSDFVEHGVLGRGGCGEVVKVRNRLDRRLYAIKKIPLFSEEGRLAKSGAAQNRKLRREVTTISRMIHKNIVRYYQAWVEGGEKYEEPIVTAKGTTLTKAAAASTSDTPGITQNLENNDSPSDDSGEGWWKSPGNTPVTDSFDEYSSCSEDASSWTVDQEYDNDIQSPLLTGMGFQNPSYSNFRNVDADKEKTSNALSSSQSGYKEPSDVTVPSSGVKVKNDGSQKVLYIQMEYCKTTLRHLIDKKDLNDIWRWVRQIVEALDYIHSRKIIHRDLKPSNIFLDSESNIRLGDFGLATTERVESSIGRDSPAENDRDARENNSEIPDISDLMGGSMANSSTPNNEHYNTGRVSFILSGLESMTGGVGTTFYRAPEQEDRGTNSRKEISYDFHADIFSLGIVLFEMFHPPFKTYMERADILNTLRGDGSSDTRGIGPNTGGTDSGIKLRFAKTTALHDETCIIHKTNWKEEASLRFPTLFCNTTPENAQKTILWCLQLVPSKRPSTKELLKSDLIPFRMELERRYLQEALQALSNPQSEIYETIVGAVFQRPSPHHLEVTYDTDAAVKASMSNIVSSNDTNHGKRKHIKDPTKLLNHLLGSLGCDANLDNMAESTMNSLGMAAVISALTRARNAGKLAKGGKESEALRGATARAAQAIGMNSATAAAITGAVDGVLGADPRVVEYVCDRLTSIFKCHGAVHLRSPLLRPRTQVDSIGGEVKNTRGNMGPAELMNDRGSVLLLPEDLTANFARAVARGGGSTVSLKRFDIDKVFQKSIAGGHPRETLEASFDILFEDPHLPGEYLEAETLMVLCQSMAIINPPGSTSFEGSPPSNGHTPIWYLRLTHTRLADSIMELCSVPQEESARKACLRIFSTCSACTPAIIRNSRNDDERNANSSETKKRARQRKCSENKKGGGVDDIDRYLETAMKEHGLPAEAAHRLRSFLSQDCLHLSPEINEALDALHEATKRLKLLDIKNGGMDVRREKRYVEVGRGIGSLRRFARMMQKMDINPTYNHHPQKTDYKSINGESLFVPPNFISIDLGLRQRQRHIHGQLLFQAVMLPDNFFNSKETDSRGNDEVTLSSTGSGVKVAEGGRYDDLVRKFRPPGNFGSSQFDRYTSAPKIKAVGIRFFVGKIVERLYVQATAGSGVSSGDFVSSLETGLSNNAKRSATIDVLRKNLGHPLPTSHSIRCLVTSVNGMDVASSGERVWVASRLWASGISAEYLPHSGAVMRLLRHGKDSGKLGEIASDWTPEQLCGVCALLQIPFVVIVQSHLLRDKGCVRLRSILSDLDEKKNSGTVYNSGSNEEVIPLAVLPSTIKNRLSTLFLSEDAGPEGKFDDSNHGQNSANPKESYVGSAKTYSSVSEKVECIYVDSDQYYGSEKLPGGKGDKGEYKTLSKIMKTTRRRVETFTQDLFYSTSLSTGGRGIPVIAVDVSFWVLRDFGTAAMRRGDQTTFRASNELTERYPEHKKVLKNLSSAIDSISGRLELGKNGRRSSFDAEDVSKNDLGILLYSTVDDKFDLLTLGTKKVVCSR